MFKKAVIDRFEGGIAVVVLEENQKVINYPKKDLPKDAKEGDWLLVEVQYEKIMKIVLDTQSKEEARQRIARKLAKLRQGGK
jgi:hypothetical protein